MLPVRRRDQRLSFRLLLSDVVDMYRCVSPCRGEIRGIYRTCEGIVGETDRSTTPSKVRARRAQASDTRNAYGAGKP
jgi:hypothetical protein